MASRRTRARLEFLFELLAVSHRVRKWCTRSRDDSNGIAPGWFLFGSAMQVAYSWGYDRDVGALRTSRLRRVLGIGVWMFAASRLFPRPADEWRSYALGGSVGRLCYRLWYGVLRPLPTDGGR